MRLGAGPIFAAEDYPGVSEELLQRLTEVFDELYTAASQQPQRESLSGSFISAASGVSTLELKNPLPQKPAHVSVDLRRDDLADFSAAWSWWKVLRGEQIQLKFIGLPASARLMYSVRVE